MIFSENTEVIYQGMYGVIDFVCDHYIVLKINPLPNKNPARLIVYRENYKQLEISKVSGK